jgi:hypothetical protein
MSKYVFTRKAGESFVFTMQRMEELEPKLREAYESVKEEMGRPARARVHPEVETFCAKAWGEMTRRLAFETQRPYDQCSREIALRAPWVYLAQGAQGDFNSFDVDLSEVRS